MLDIALIDDIDGGEACETLGFSLDGVSYEIDVSSKRADELRANLWPFINKARKVSRGGLGAQRRTVVGTQARHDRAQSKAIRDWAKRKKIELPERARIPRHIVEQYGAEAGR